MFACTVIALFDQSVSAFNTFSPQMRHDLDVSQSFVSLLLGIGSAGLQFTLPGGRLRDVLGEFVSLTTGAVTVVGALMAMSFTSSPPLLLLEMVGLALGTGTCFVSALSAVVEIGRVIGISVVSIGMSLSLAVYVHITSAYKSHSGCGTDTPHCWREYVRLYAAVSAGAYAVGAVGLFLYVRGKRAVRKAAEEAGPQVLFDGDLSFGDLTPISQHKTPAPPVLRRTLSMRESLHVFDSAFFWAFFCANLFGVGAVMLVITQGKQAWDDYNDDHGSRNWNESVASMFAYSAGLGNLLVPNVADFLEKRKVCYQKTVLTALMVLHACVLGTVGLLDVRRDSQTHSTRLAFAGLLASLGFFLGTYVVLIPQAVGRAYSTANFGIYLSYIQLGSSAFIIVLPVIATAVKNATGSFKWVYFALAIAVLGSAVFVGCVRPLRKYARQCGMPVERRRASRSLFA